MSWRAGSNLMSLLLGMKDASEFHPRTMATTLTMAGVITEGAEITQIGDVDIKMQEKENI